MTAILPISRIPVTPKPPAVPSLWNLIYDEIDDRFALLNAGKQEIGIASDQLFLQQGYQKLSSGLIIQWGRYSYTATSGALQLFSFPLAFPNNCFMVVGSIGAELGSYVLGFDSISNSQFAAGGNTMGISGPVDLGFGWIAIGH